MSSTVSTDSIRNGVDTGQLFATLDVIDAQPELARFRFRVTNHELHASTAAGRPLVQIAERLADTLSADAGRHDRDGSYPFGGLDAVRESGYLVAAAPSELGAGNAVDLAACRTILERAVRLVDEHDREGNGPAGPDVLVALFAEVQAAKTFVNEAATRVVDRALALSGGAGYLNGSPLARAHRDVRAGASRHPLGANRAYDLLADVGLGREVTLR